MHIVHRHVRLAVQLGVAAVGYLITSAVEAGGDQGWRYGAAAFGFLIARLLIVAFNRPRIGAPRSYALVVPTYNEDVDTLEACLTSALMQHHRPVAIVVVDDGSAHPADEAVDRVRPLAGIVGVPLIAVRHHANLGKREAIMTGRHAVPEPFDVLVCVDSDTVLRPDACRHLTGAFVDRRVKCATGLVVARNRDTNVLTRLIDVRYTGAFEFDRASQSALGGAMACACGSLAGYRTTLIDRWAADFVGQTFAGERCTFGDDRRLTAYALREGRSVYVRDALAWTDVPDNMGQFTRQQIRWSRSWGRESLLAMREQPWLKPGRWIITIETVTWAVFTVSLLASMVRAGMDGLDWRHVVVIAVAAVARSGAYLHRPDLLVRQRVAGLVLAPVYSVLNLWVLLPLRLYAMATMARSEWGTRNPASLPQPVTASA